MRSSSMGFSDFLPFRTSDRHFEFASRRCLRGDRPRSATRIDRRILLKKDLLAFGRASWIDSQSCSATWVLLPSTERRFTSLAGLPVCCCSFCGASFAKSQLRMPRRDLVARERLVVAYYAIAAATRGVCHLPNLIELDTNSAQAPGLSQILDILHPRNGLRAPLSTQSGHSRARRTAMPLPKPKRARESEKNKTS